MPCHAREWLLVLGLMSCISTVHAEEVFYAHPDLHLWFTLNTDTKEAMLGRGESEERNALNFPPLDDDYWINGQQNLWASLVIPESLVYAEEEYRVVGVHRYAFYRSTEVRKISLPESIRTIGAYAFAWCTYLEEINIPTNVTEIASHAFELCWKIPYFNLPKGLKTIGASAFGDCSLIKEIVIPSSCTHIAEDAFRWCTNLSKLIIEDSEESLLLGWGYGLSLDYEGTEKATYRGLFADSPIDTFYLGRNLTYQMTEWSESYSPFHSINGYCLEVSTPRIRTGKHFKEVRLGKYVTSISDELFMECIIDNELTLPDALISIGKDAFYSNSTNGVLNQTDIVFSETLESIGERAFQRNSSLRFIHCMSETPPSLPDLLYSNAFAKCDLMVMVPDGKGPTYRADEKWGTFPIIDALDEELVINVKSPGSLYSRLLAQGFQVSDLYKIKLKGSLNEDDWNLVKTMENLYSLDLTEVNCTEIPFSLGTTNNKLVTIKVPNELSVIPDEMFKGCTHLTGIFEIPQTCGSIGYQSFWGTAIQGLSYSHKIEIGNDAFAYCKNLKNINLTVGTDVGSNAFWSSGVETVTICKDVKVGDNAFFYCLNLKDVTFEDCVKSIGTSVFEACYKLKKVTFAGLVEEYGNSPLTSVEEVHIADIAKWCKQKFQSLDCSPLYYADHLYVNGEEITKLVIPETVSRIENYSFYNCKILKKITLPEGLKSIGEYVFYGCSDIDSLLIPSSLEKIEGNAFYGCKKIVELEFPLNVDSIGDNAFGDCSNLVEIIARWDNPFMINENTFAGVSSDCNLYVPILSASKYLNAGWSVPNMKETGIINILVNNGGVVLYNEEEVKASGEYMFSPYKSFSLSIVPNDGYSIKKVKLNGQIVTSMVENGKLLIEEPEENQMLSVVFADNSIPIGDSDGNKAVEVADAMNVANHILKKKTESFIDYASDVNDDEQINVTDAIMIISKIKEKK